MTGTDSGTGVPAPYIPPRVDGCTRGGPAADVRPPGPGSAEARRPVRGRRADLLLHDLPRRGRVRRGRRARGGSARRLGADPLQRLPMALRPRPSVHLGRMVRAVRPVADELAGVAGALRRVG